MARQAKNGRFTTDPVRKAGGTTGEQTGEQQPSYLANLNALQNIVGINNLFANGGSQKNPMGYPGYLANYYGTYPVYRWILSHPIVRLARAVRYGAVVSSAWEYQVVKERTGSEGWLKDVQRVFNNLRQGLMSDFYKRGCDFGWAGGELIWERSENEYELVRVKPLLQDNTECLVDANGNFAGLKNHGTDNEEIGLTAPYKAWKFTYDGEAGYCYGRSWLENIRDTAWKDWLDTAQQLQRLTQKITGIMMVVLSPAGTFQGPNGRVYHRDAALKLMAGLVAGSPGGWLPKASATPDAKGRVDLAKFRKETTSLADTEFKLLDFGKQVMAIDPLLKRMQHDEKLMFAGALRSDRTGLEADKGSRADAEVHTDTGTINAEEEDEDFATQCQPLVDAYLTANHGERAKGVIAIKPPSLIDRKSQVLKAVLMSIMNNPDACIEFARVADVNKISSILDIPLTSGYKGENIMKNVKAAAAKKNNLTPKKPAGDPSGGRPTNA